MTTKKKTKNVIGKADAFYIEAHFGKKTACEIANDLGLTAEGVEAYLKQLKESGVEPTKPKSKVEKAHFAVHQPEESNSLSVSMTDAASAAGDQPKSSKRNEKFFEKWVGDGIHIIDPKRPVH